MTYNPNIPQPADLLSVSQSDLLVNFQQANTRFAYDHYEFDFAGGAPAPYDVAVAGDKGKHRQLTCVRVSGDIGNAGAEELALYNKDDAGGNQEWFMRRESGGTVIQMTAGDPVTAAVGQSFLPGGILIQWGQQSSNNATTQTIVFGTAFAAAPYSVMATFEANAGSTRSFINVQQGTVAANQFIVNTRDQSGNAIGMNRTIYWIAIGPK